MNTLVSPAAPARWARGAAAAVVIFVVGFLGLMGAFSDLTPRETGWLRIGAMALLYLVGGALVGLLLPRFWYLAALAAWGPMCFGVLAVMALRISDRALPPPHVGMLVVLLAGIPLFALACGYFGRWFVRRR